MSNSTNKSIADHEAVTTHHVAEGSHPEHAVKGEALHGPGARDDRARKLDAEVQQRAKKK